MPFKNRDDPVLTLVCYIERLIVDCHPNDMHITIEKLGIVYSMTMGYRIMGFDIVNPRKAER